VARAAVAVRGSLSLIVPSFDPATSGIPRRACIDLCF
jgi:hypothetical protein